MAGLKSLKKVIMLPFIESKPFDVADISPKAQLWSEFVAEGNDGDKVWRDVTKTECVALRVFFAYVMP
jgi:hypothetical protein